MKKSTFIASLMGSVLSLSAWAFTGGSNTNGTKSEKTIMAADPEDSYAEIKFDTLQMSFGTFPASAPERSVTFRYVNTGTAPLVINQAVASCGCTVPSYSKEAVVPGHSGTIEVKYNGKGKFPGHFTKTVTIRTNAKNSMVRLVVEGDMTEN